MSQFRHTRPRDGINWEGGSHASGNGQRRNRSYRKFVTPDGFKTKATSDVYKEGDSFDEQGTFEACRFGPTDDGFIIGTFAVEGGEPIIVKGTVPGFVLGAPYHVMGKVVNDKTWGIQVKATHVVGTKPTTEGQLEAFLGSGAIPGIGRVTAKKIVKHFGKDTLDILQSEPERLSEVSGLGEKTTNRIIEALPGQLKYREVIGFFSSLGISVKTINRLIEEYGGGAKEIIEKNPYILCRVKGFAFTRADSIAMKMGISKTDSNRLEAGLMAVVRYVCNAEGHTVVPEDMLIAQAQEKLEVNDITLLSRRVEDLVRSRRLIKDELGYHLKYLYDAEAAIKKALSYNDIEEWLLDDAAIDRYLKSAEERKGFQLTDEQAGGVRNAFKKKVSVLSGAAGAGKAQPLTSKVLTEVGWKDMGDICEGDRVWTPSGKLADVTAVFPQGELEVVEVELSDGRVVECCEDHIWRVMDMSRASDGMVDMTVSEILSCGHGLYSTPVAGKTQGSPVFYLPKIAPVPFDGKWEGPGSVEDVARGLLECQGDPAASGAKGAAKGAAQTLGLIDDMAAIEASDKRQRARFAVALLGNGRSPVAIADAKAADLAARVIRSLGVKCEVKKATGGASLELTVSLGEYTSVIKPIAAGREPLAGMGYDPRAISASIKAIRKTGRKEEMQCIMVDDADHLYITDGYVPTHNTAVSSTIVEICKMAGIPVCLMSPTGRAAKHLSDTCGGIEPGFTMHRALSIQMRKARDDDFFDEDQSQQFMSQHVTEAVKHFDEAQLVIADEASMMDTEMASILFKACKHKHLMLVGDPNQLPSVGPGRVLGDLMESSYSTHGGMLTFLTKVFRQKDGSPVINAANAIQQGDSPTSIPGVKFLPVESNEEVPQMIEKHVLPYLQKRQLGYENYAFLSPIKKTPFAGVDALNKFLRPRLNPHYKKPEDESKEFLFQRGDFVMQTKNNYDVDIYNGDIGIVSEIDRDGGVEVLFSGDDEEICYEKDEVYGDHQIIPAFAMTVHKSQGDQYDTVIVVLTSSQFPMLNRNLLYTAVTRAENTLMLIGDAKAFAMAAGNQRESRRLTGLRGI